MKWLGQLWQSFLSVVKILLQSKWHTHLPSSFGNPEELLILANGPSLSRTVQEAPEFIKGKTLLAVNFCATSPMFEQLRPEIYLIADPLFWIVPEKRVQLFQTLAEKITWPMNFFVPARALKTRNGSRCWQAIPTSGSAFTTPLRLKVFKVSAIGFSVEGGECRVRITY